MYSMYSTFSQQCTVNVFTIHFLYFVCLMGYYIIGHVCSESMFANFELNLSVLRRFIYVLYLLRFGPNMSVTTTANNQPSDVFH